MRFIKFLLLIFLFFILIGYSQENIKEALEYYPMDKGIYWEYLAYYSNYVFPPFESEIEYFSVKIIGDTILENNKYKVKEYRNLPDNDIKRYEFERVDSTSANVYRYDFIKKKEFLIDSLLAQPGDSSKAARGTLPQVSYFTICIDLVEDSVLNQITKVKQFWDIGFIPGFQYKLAKGFGYYGDDNCEFTCSGTELLYAEINGKSYGSKVSSINRKYPTQLNSFILNQNYPNPFNPKTTIRYTVGAHSNAPLHVVLNVYNVLGQKISTLVSEEQTTGQYTVRWDASNLSNGVYYYRLTTDDGYSKIRKMMVLK